MKTKDSIDVRKERAVRWTGATGLIALVLLFSPGLTVAQQLTLANPHWNITLSDFGYSDFMLDNTPGFEGREYLSGEWGAAVAYQVAGSPPTAPQWLEPHFIFPDWDTTSSFSVVSPLAEIGLNADGLPIARSVIANGHLEIALRHEMLDTVVGTPMGTTPATSTGAVAFINSDRYVLKQTITVKNISGASISGLRVFQLLHGLVSQRGVFDNRVHAGPLSEFRYDATFAGVDANAVSGGSSSAGLEDFIGFHASVAPGAYEIGYFGVEGNGVDGHAIGKPSEGVHLSVENNWQTAPFSTRLNTDEFAPPQRWVAGAQRWDLGALAAGQSTSIDVLLTLRTGTKVTRGNNNTGGCNGGSHVPGGVDYEFEDVSSDGSCFGEYSAADENEIEIHIAEGMFGPLTFLTPGGPVQIWEMDFSGAYSGAIHLTFGYDGMLLPEGFDQDALSIFHFDEGTWQKVPSVVDPVSHTISISTTTLGAFALGVDSAVTFTIDATVAPANSGTVTGAGTYAQGANITLVASANPDHAFAYWSDNGSTAALSPSYTFTVRSNRTLVANFVPAGDGRIISTSSSPSNGGSTTGDGAYAVGASATVSATPNAGYKFSKWLENGVTVSGTRDYTFTVTTNRLLVAKFKPVFTVNAVADPPAGGDPETDRFYEAGELATLKAKPNSGWSLVNWTQNGVIVSDDENYSFNVTANRDLVAHFAEGNRIDVFVEPVNAGSCTGGGVYPDNQAVFVEAIANPGYVFVNWTEADVPVSTSASYSFDSKINRMLVANFIAQPGLKTIIMPGSVALLWPAGAAGWVLQESADLSPGSWQNSSRPVEVTGNQKQVIVPSAGASGYFRLVHQ